MFTREVGALVTRVSGTLLDYHSTIKTRMTDAETEGWAHMCLAVKNVLLPYIQVKLNTVIYIYILYFYTKSGKILLNIFHFLLAASFNQH